VAAFCLPLFEVARVVRVFRFIRRAYLGFAAKKSKKSKFVDVSHLEMVERFNAFLSRVA
jgi:hypothetical protein